jgi:hypothetical protein
MVLKKIGNQDTDLKDNTVKATIRKMNLNKYLEHFSEEWAEWEEQVASKITIINSN